MVGKTIENFIGTDSFMCKGMVLSGTLERPEPIVAANNKAVTAIVATTESGSKRVNCPYFDRFRQGSGECNPENKYGSTQVGVAKCPYYIR